MANEADPGWEQPPFGAGLDEIAVDLITTVLQQVFADLDPVELVAASGVDLADEDRQTVADMIDSAIVEIEIGFPRHRGDPPEGFPPPVLDEKSA